MLWGRVAFVHDLSLAPFSASWMTNRGDVIPVCPFPFSFPFKGDKEALVGSSCWRKGMQSLVAE